MSYSELTTAVWCCRAAEGWIMDTAAWWMGMCAAHCSAAHTPILTLSDRLPQFWKRYHCIDIQGVQQNCSHLVICSFDDFYTCKLQKLGHFWKIQEICYMIGTRILKIDLEIAEIIEVKVGNHQLQIYILLLHRGRKIISLLKVATLTSIISVISKSIFKILVPIM